jgi:hypothetical protein
LRRRVMIDCPLVAATGPDVQALEKQLMRQE